jgi:hypothetical protein
MQEELNEACGTQGDKQDRVFHLVLKLKLEKMGDELVAMSPITKHSHQTKVKMPVVKAEKGHFKGSLQGQEVGQIGGDGQVRFYQKASQDAQGQKGRDLWPLNPRNGEGWALIEKESSKGEASKDTIQVVEQVQSSSDF